MGTVLCPASAVIPDAFWSMLVESQAAASRRKGLGQAERWHLGPVGQGCHGGFWALLGTGVRPLELRLPRSGVGCVFVHVPGCLFPHILFFSTRFLHSGLKLFSNKTFKICQLWKEEMPGVVMSVGTSALAHGPGPGWD